MSSELIGVIGLCALLGLLSAGVPIAAAMGLVGAAGLCILLGHRRVRACESCSI